MGLVTLKPARGPAARNSLAVVVRGCRRIALLACALLAAGCGRETTTPPTTFALSGRVHLVGPLTAANGQYLGTRTVTDADGVPVDLLLGNTVVGTTHTTDGAFRFAGLSPGGYFARARIFGALGVRSAGLTIAARDVAAPDPLVLESVGDLYPAPNPVDTATTIVFSATSLGSAVLRVLALDGTPVRTLYVNRMLEPGLYATDWNARDDEGNLAAPGCYWMTFESGADQRAQLLFR